MISDLDRREVFFGGLLTVVWTAGCPATAFAQPRGESGCEIPDTEVSGFFERASRPQAFQTGNEWLEPRSGNPALDRAFAQTLGRLARTFDVLPAFAYYNDSNEPNARATSQVLLERTDGTVMFGHTFLQRLLARPERDAAVVAVCAHEFGHIVSYKNNFIGRLAPDGRQPFRAEQYADFIAGFFAGVRKLANPTYPAMAFASTQEAHGGPTRGSHGTGQERREAVLAGFEAAHSRRMTPREGINAAFTFAMSR